MRKTLVGLLVAATAVIGLTAAPAKADVVYIGSDGIMHNISSDVVLPSSTMYVDTTLTQPAVVEPVTTQVITQPAVINTTPVIQTSPVVIDRTRDRGLLHLGVWPLLDFSLF